MFDKREPERTELAADLAALEQQLAALTPAAPRIDRDKLMFEAGRAAVSRPRWPGYIAGPSWAGSRFWPAATAMMTAATLLLATMLVWQRQNVPLVGRAIPTDIGTIQAVDGVATSASSAAVRPEITAASWAALPRPTTGYLGVRYIALTQGVGALEPRFPTAGGERDSSNDLPRTQRDMLNELLPSSQRAINPRS